MTPRKAQKLLKKMSSRRARTRQAAEAELLAHGPAVMEPLLEVLRGGLPGPSAAAVRVLLQLCAGAHEAGVAGEDRDPYRTSPRERQSQGTVPRRDATQRAVKAALAGLVDIDLTDANLRGVDQPGANLRGADLQRVNELWITSLSASRWDHDHDHGRSNKDTQFAAGRAPLSAHESRTYMSKDGQLG